MSAVPKLVADALEELRIRFEAADYNPTPIIDLGVLIANADGVVDANEIDTLRRILVPMLGESLDVETVRLLVDATVRVVDKAGADARLRLVAEILLDCDAVEEGVTVALGVAFASEGLSEPQRKTIGDLAEATSLGGSRLAELIEQVRTAYPK